MGGVFTLYLPAMGRWLYPAVVLTVVVAGVVASWTPARRALSIQPVEAIRYD